MNMKIRQALAASLAAAFLMTAPSAFASHLSKACKSDLKKFGCEAKTDQEVHECIEKNEKEGSKKEGLSSKCYKAHESYEKKMGKEEKNEKEEHHEAGESH
jgi:hypothetical protein